MKRNSWLKTKSRWSLGASFCLSGAIFQIGCGGASESDYWTNLVARDWEDCFRRLGVDDDPIFIPDNTGKTRREGYVEVLTPDGNTLRFSVGNSRFTGEDESWPNNDLTTELLATVRC